MLKKRLSEKYDKNGLNGTPLSRKYVKAKPMISERNLASFGLVFSLVVVFAKLYYGNQDFIGHVIFERKLVSYEVIAENGQVMFTNSWKTVVRYSSIWLPLVCGLFTTYFTWMCVYLDSNIPGINPPSPISPKKYRLQSGHTFHLNYIFAVLVGTLVASYMYLKKVSIEY